MMSAEERELMEEMEAIKEAQKAAKELFGVPKEKVNKVQEMQEKAAPPSNEAGGPLEREKAPEAAMARWLARTGVQGVGS